MMAIITAFIFRDKPILIAALAVLPFYLWLLFKKTIRAAIIAVKMSIISLTLAASYEFPLYLLFLVALVWFTRVYYKNRFDIIYPSLE